MVLNRLQQVGKVSKKSKRNQSGITVAKEGSFLKMKFSNF